MSFFFISYLPLLVMQLGSYSCPWVLVCFLSVKDTLRCHFQTLVQLVFWNGYIVYIKCICLLCVCFSHSFFFPFLSLILCVSFCLAQQSSLLDCISQSCVSACCNLVPWSKKVPCPWVGPSSCHICSLMLLVAFSICAVLFCSSVVTCFCFLF